MSKKMNKSHYIPGLDGLRALAVLAVIFYHLFPAFLPGGYLGVDIFFVLSGFLITTLLITEHARHGKIRLKDFWLRRARRLLPALFTVVLAISSVAFFARGDILVGIGQQILGASTFSSNWIEVLSGTNYFSDNSTHIFMNFWSLAVEEQFYLAWPFIVLLLVGVIKNPRVGVAATALLALASAGLMAYLFSHGAPATRVYYGTDTHVFGLMIGACLAFTARTQTVKQPLRRVSQPFWKLRTIPRLTQIFGLTALGGLFALLFLLPDQAWFTYNGGLLLASLLTAVVIVATISTPGILQKAFEWKPLKWAGMRSYGIYLWHWPVLVLLRYLLPGTLPWWITPLCLFVLAFAAADLSYRYVEMPIRKHGLRQTLRRAVRRTHDTRPLRIPARPHFATLAVLLGLALTAGAVVNAPIKTSAQIRIEEGQNMLKKQQAAKKKEAKKKAAVAAAKARQPVTGSEVSAIGDSVMLASAPYLQQALPGIAIDAAVSRSLRRSGLESIEAQIAAGTLRGTVVVALGTNGYYGTGMLEQMIDKLKDHNVVLVTAHADREWTASNNDNARAAAKKYKNVAVADWNQAISPRPELLSSDGVHPISEEGDKIYAQCIKDALKKFE